MVKILKVRICKYFVKSFILHKPFLPFIILKVMAKLKQQTKYSRAFWPKYKIKIKGIGMSNYHMHYGLTELVFR